MMLTTEAMITEKPKKAVNSAPGAGMEEMDDDMY
jgi:hypothetical protein